MIRRLSEKFKQLQKNSQALDLYDMEIAQNLIEAEREIKVYSSVILPPFLTYLELSQNFVQVINYIQKNIPEFDEDIFLKDKALYCKDDMKMLSRNFDILVSKDFMSLIKSEKEFNFLYRRHPMNLINEAFASISYIDTAYREWAKDAEERVSKCYVVLRLLADKYFYNYPVIEDMIYFALVGYKLDRTNLLYNLSSIYK